MTLRRYYLDLKLSQIVFGGKVLDVGGHRNRRGSFRIPYDEVESWELVNIDPSTEPDYCCSAEDIPVNSLSYDQVILTEVLEHLEKPESVLDECYRVLKSSGSLFISMPFLFPVHADPHDYQRWTSDKFYLTLNKIGFKKITIEPMGNIIAVIHDLLYVSLVSTSSNSRTFANKVLAKLLLTPLCWIGQRNRIADKQKQRITTGWFVTAVK